MESPFPRASSPRRSALPAARHGGSIGLARDLLISIIESDHILLLSNEMLYEIVVPDTLLITPIRDRNDTNQSKPSGISTASAHCLNNVEAQREPTRSGQSYSAEATDAVGPSLKFKMTSLQACGRPRRVRCIPAGTKGERGRAAMPHTSVDRPSDKSLSALSAIASSLPAIASAWNCWSQASASYSASQARSS
jgi:hypothetical protein